MDKVFNYDNCTVKVHIPEIKNKNLHKATEEFMREVLKERGERNEC